MIKIAIVDDEKQEQKILVQYYRKLQRELNMELSLVVFSSGEQLLEGFDGSFDLICLDIDMGGMDGVSTAKEIRKMDREVKLVFVTNMAQMAIRGYEVQALDFILKPVQYYAFAMKMQSVLSMIGNDKSRNLVLGTPGGMQKISTADLMYVEVHGHYLDYHARQGVFKQKASLKELEEKLAGLSFKRCNNCYLVNLKYVNGVDKDDVKVGEDWLKISRPRKKEFLQALANYLGGIRL